MKSRILMDNCIGAAADTGEARKIGNRAGRTKRNTTAEPLWTSLTISDSYTTSFLERMT